MPVCVGCSQEIDLGAQFCPRCGTPNPEAPTLATPTGGGAQAPPLAEGEIRSRLQGALGRDFIVEEPIGQGGFATVFAVQDRKLSRRVAVKVLHPDLTASASTVRRFIREAEAAASLSHPHILPIFFVGEGQGMVYFGMPLVEGESLDQLLAREHQLSEREVVRIGIEIADALAEAHSRGIVHRDVKAANVLLQGPRRRVLVADFGIAKAATGSSGTLTGTGVVIGSPHYMSPEQASGSGNVDARSDIYSLGVVLWQALAGRVPFDAPDSQDVVLQQIARPVPSVRESRRSVSPALARVIGRCTEKKREDRFGSAAELSEALRALASAEMAAPVLGRRSLARAGIAAAALVAIGIMALVVKRQAPVTAAPGEAGAATAATRTAAPVIAVLPFEVSGPGDSTQLSRSAARLLTNALTTGYDVQTVDVNRFLSLWTSERRALTAPLDSNAAFAYRLGANQVVYGSSVEAGGQVRLSVDVYDTRDLGRLGHVEETGDADSLFALVDRLAGTVARVFCQRPAFNPRNLCFDVAARPAAPVTALVPAGDSLPASPAYHVRVGRDGAVQDLRIARASSPEATQAGLEAVQAAAFVPARARGAAVEAWGTVEVQLQAAAAAGAAAAGSAPDASCEDPDVSIENRGGACWDQRPAPLVAPVVPAPASCPGTVTPVTLVVRLSADGEPLGEPVVRERSNCPAFTRVAAAFVADLAFEPATKAGHAVPAYLALLVTPAATKGDR